MPLLPLVALPITRNQELLIYVGIMTSVQLAVAARFGLLLRRRTARGEAGSLPACVIVPCKGAGPGLEDSARALLAQDHPDYQVLFVVPARSDPAFEVFSRVAAEDPRARVLVSEAPAPTRCSGKGLDLLYALDRLPERCRVVAFADADLKVGPGWLAALASALDEPRVAVATSCALYVAADPGWLSFVRMCWFCLVIPPYGSLNDGVCGHSYALRREDLETLKVKELFGRALLEDVAVSHAVRAAGRRARFVPEALSACEEPCDWKAFTGVLNKWVYCARVYEPLAWACALIAVFMHLWIFYWPLRFPPGRWIPLALLAGDGAALALTLSLYQAAAPRVFSGLHRCWRPLWLWGFLAAPLVWGACLMQAAASLVTTKVRWAGRVYRLRGPLDVEVVG